MGSPVQTPRCRRAPHHPSTTGVGGLAVALAFTSIITLGGCSGSSGGAAATEVEGGASSVRLEKIEFGKLVDVFGLRTTGAGTTVELFATDLLVGPNIEDERPSSSTKGDDEILYDFIGTDPNDLQARLLITREVGSAEFSDAVNALDDELLLVTPAKFGQSTATQPFTVVARDAGIRLTFDGTVSVTEDFFVERGENGEIIGLKNTEAIQLLQIAGDPAQAGTLEQITTRIVPRGNEILLDPVLLGDEGVAHQTRNNAAGLPESADQTGANIRLAIALDGPLAMPGIRVDRTGSLTGNNLNGLNSVIRDFRSGNRNDDTPAVSQGFLRDSVPPRLIGQILTYIERVEPIDEFTQVVTLYKGGTEHEVDRGDVLRLVIDNTGVPAAVTEVTADPLDDFENPGAQHVRAIVRRVVATDSQGAEFDVFEAWDPSGPTSNRFWQQFAGGTQPPPYPGTPQERAPWLINYAPRGVLVAEFTAERINSEGNAYGDDPRHFVTFSPEPLPGPGGVTGPANENVSPFAAAIVQFSKPVDMTTVKALDTFFFATRDLLSESERDRFIAENNIDPDSFIQAKYVTPHLVAAQRFDEDGSQTAVRLQPSLGFYLDEAIRQGDDPLPFEQKMFRYFLHVVGGATGIRDLAGNQIDFQAQASVIDNIVIPFSLDTRAVGGRPNFDDNRVVTVARRFADVDEDEQPSYYVTDFTSPAWEYERSYTGYSEVQSPGAALNEFAFNLADAFGAVVYLPDGTLTARPTTRVRQAADDVNQQAPASQNGPERWCPLEIGTEEQVASNTTQARFGSPLQNPLNQFGCRLQTVWREIDLNLSKSNPLDFNLDVEQMWWCPFTAGTLVFDEYDRLSLFLGHSESRPEPCVGQVAALPSMTNSGLATRFANNYLRNLNLAGGTESQPSPHTAFVDESLRIVPSDAIRDPNNAYRYMPLPEFERPYFVWRDERVLLQGGNSSEGTDTGGGTNFDPYILSPFLAGRGRAVSEDAGSLSFVNGFWDNRNNRKVQATGSRDRLTNGLVGSIALPLLADFWVYPDDPNLPVSNPFLASGANGWQISLAVTSGPQPNFRVYSAGGLVSGQGQTVAPGSADWNQAAGGFNPAGRRTTSGDNSFFWMMADYVKRVSVMTSGFVDMVDPHRILEYPPADPRLGPYFDPFDRTALQGVMPSFQHNFEPPIEQQPAGTSLVAEFRGAGVVDEGTMTLPGPWAAARGQLRPAPDPINFSLDPLKAGDAHIRKADDRPFGGSARNGWTHYYNRNVTDYVADPNDLMDEEFTTQFAAPNEAFLPHDVRYFNWRLVFGNNVDASPPVTPRIESFLVTYRFEDQ
ncbi:MAG: hypothetical protein AAF628_00970 [Planctomycetota bacterium]